MSSFLNFFAKQTKIEEDLKVAKLLAADLQDGCTADLEASIANVEETNRKVRANLDKDKAEEDARTYRNQYNELTGKIEENRSRKKALLDAAELPLPELSVREGELVYKGQSGTTCPAPSA